MKTHSIRVGVGDPDGYRSSEWLVMWKSGSSDVYVAARTLGGTFKASIHASGRCHIRPPVNGIPLADTVLPQFVDSWNIRCDSTLEFPFAIVIPASELRHGAWADLKNKGTKWISAPPSGTAVEIAIFLTRAEPRPIAQLANAGWTNVVLVERLPDGRDLWVVAGSATVSRETVAEMQALKRQRQALIGPVPATMTNPRMILVACDEKGTRRFVDIAGDLPQTGA